MELSSYNNEKAILAELGNRIQQYRISLNITQAELAQKCGISAKTVVRIEGGDDLKLSNMIKILNVFGLVENLDILVPKLQPEYKAMFEGKSVRKRAKTKNKNASNIWVWGEDKSGD